MKNDATKQKTKIDITITGNFPTDAPAFIRTLNRVLRNSLNNVSEDMYDIGNMDVEYHSRGRTMVMHFSSRPVVDV